MESSVEHMASLFKAYNYEIILGFCALFLMYVITTARKKARNNFPPGPMGLPLLGYLPFLSKDPHLDYMKLGEKYGDVFSIKLGSKNFVILNGIDVTLEALMKPELLGRPVEKWNDRKATPSVYFGSDFSLWKEQHSHVVKFLKDQGFGKSRIEGDIMYEINRLMEVLSGSEARPIDITKFIYSFIPNNIYSLICGKQIEYDNPKGRLLNKNSDHMSSCIKHYCLETCLPWIKYIPFTSKFRSFPEAKSAYISNAIFSKNEINEHLKSLNPDHIRDFIDRYLIEIDKRKAENPNTFFNHNVLIGIITDLFVVSHDTVSAAIIWNLCIMVAYPDVEMKIQKEIMEVIGPDKRAELLDMKKMPYTNAVILEGLRWKPTIPLSVKRCALADTKLGGYNIKKGTIVVPNFWAIHHDPRNWEEPNKFKPERFLSEDGMSVVKPRCFLPFSEGRRACPGESMALMQIFLYLTSILQEFDVAFPEGMEPTFKGKLYLSYRPEPFLMRFIPKNKCSKY